MNRTFHGGDSMRLAECLNQSDIGNLRKIALRHAIHCPLYSKNSLLQEILNRFSDPNYVAERLEALPLNVRQALQEIALENRNEFAETELLSLLRRQQPSELKNLKKITTTILTELLEEGILFATGAPLQKSYRCPVEIWRRIQSHETQQMRQSVQTSSQEPTWICDDARAMTHDAVTFLLFLARHEIRLTQDSVIFKRQQQQILDLFKVKEDVLPNHIGFRFGYSRRFHDYPDRFSLIYDHLFDEGCLEEDPSGVLRLNEDKSGKYMTLSENKRAELLFRFYVRTYRIAIPTLGRIITRIGKLASHTWVYAKSLEDALIHLVRDFYYEPKDQVYPHRIIQMLVYLGFIAQGQQVQNDILYQLTPSGSIWLEATTTLDDGFTETNNHSIRPQAVILPTFDILVPEEADSTYAWDLQKLAEPINRDHMRTYRMTRESIYQALLNGWKLEQIREFLLTISGTEIPKNVDHALRDWSEEYGSVSLHLYCIMTCKDENISSTIEQLHPIVARSPIRFNDHSLAFVATDGPVLVELLLKLGYMVSYPSECKKK